jgi:hypothetical protein
MKILTLLFAFMLSSSSVFACNGHDHSHHKHKKPQTQEEQDTTAK